MSVEKSKLPTLIESILRRAGGTIVTLGSTSYHFKPDAADRHVAQVANEDHAERLLSISEGYREVEYLDAPLGSVTAPAPPTAPSPQPQPDPVVPPAPAVSTIAPVSAPDGASEPEGTEPANTGEGSDPDSNQLTATQPAEPAVEPTGEATATAKTEPAVPEAKTAPTHDELVAAYQQKFGRKPHHQWSDEIIAAKLAEG